MAGEPPGVAGDEAVLLTRVLSAQSCQVVLLTRVLSAQPRLAVAARPRQCGELSGRVGGPTHHEPLVAARPRLGGVREAVVRGQRGGGHDVGEVQRWLRLLREPRQPLLGRGGDAAQRPPECGLLPGALPDTELLEHVVSVGLVHTPAPEAHLTKMIICTVRLVAEAVEALAPAGRARHGVEHGLGGRDPVEDQQPGHRLRPRVRHHRLQELVNRHSAALSKYRILGIFFYVESLSLAHSSRELHHVLQILDKPGQGTVTENFNDLQGTAPGTLRTEVTIRVRHLREHEAEFVHEFAGCQDSQPHLEGEDSHLAGLVLAEGEE